MIFDLVYPQESNLPLFPRPTVDAPGEFRPRPGEEMLPVVEPSGLVIGQATRAACHSGTHLLHPVVHLHLIDRTGRIYLQKRSASKLLWPGRWDTAVGGHVSFGEQVPDALAREAAEEIGLVDFTPSWLETYTWETERDSELVIVFALVGHPDLRPDNPEVTEGRWWTEEEIRKGIEGHRLFTPNFESEFERIRDVLFAML